MQVRLECQKFEQAFEDVARFRFNDKTNGRRPR